MQALTLLTEDVIDDIAIGAAILGTGGGGDPRLGALSAKHAIRQFGPVEVLQPDQVADDALVVPISMMGAPTVAIEKFMAYRQLDLAFQAMEQRLGGAIAATFPIEIGGGNSMVPIVAAARYGLPLVDCDAMGRAFPESQMVTFYLDDLPSAPNVLVDERGNLATLEPVDGIWAEKMARAIVDQMGGSALICDYPMNGAALKRSALKGTLSQAWQLGRAVREGKGQSQGPVETVVRHLNGYKLIDGKIVDVERKTEGGFARGQLKIRALAKEDSREVRVQFQNEFLLAEDLSEGGRPLAMTPDLISILDLTTGTAITTENLHYGQRISLIAYPCDPKWRTAKGLSVVGPDYFGYPVAYQPIEQLMGASA